MSADYAELCKMLKSALLELHASGQEGFEGLVRDVYREATGVPLVLQKPGPQGGVDEIAESTALGIVVGVEAKRYRDSTALRFDDLKSKLVDAATRENAIDLWILVSSKEISGDDRAALCRIGDKNGLGVVVLDWRSGADVMAPLPLLLALAPNAVKQHLGEMIAEALSAVKVHPEFETQRAELLNVLTRPDLGLVHAAVAVKQEISKALESRQNARSRLQNPIDLYAPDRIWTPRDGHCAVIREWTQEAASKPICVALGEEGAGKTWLMFDWWRRETQPDHPPLILWLPARDVASGELHEVLGTALAKWVAAPKRDVAFWARRTELWRRTCGSSHRPFIWLMLDAVNEGNAQQHVLALLMQSLDSKWQGVVGILLSDRPGHWQRVFKDGKLLDAPPPTVRVGRFTSPL
jgi:hypothetical protein